MQQKAIQQQPILGIEITDCGEHSINYINLEYKRKTRVAVCHNERIPPKYKMSWD